MFEQKNFNRFKISKEVLKHFQFLLFLHLSIMNAICRKAAVYPVSRIFVPDDKISWNVSWPSYSPPYFTAEHLKNCSWADPEIGDENFNPVWNAKDGNIDRRSFDNNAPIKYEVVNNYPLNPRGRTGICGRGRLGRWGPNHAADAVVTRWKFASDGTRVNNPSTGQPVLQFLAILRKDCRKWAIPGGFLNAGEESTTATLRELFEEAINVDKFSDSIKTYLEEFFKCGKQVYKGYVDDPRNTDNAWIETTASNFHDEQGDKTDKLILEARDDAADVKWIDIVENMDIYETHSDILKSVNELNIKHHKKNT